MMYILFILFIVSCNPQTPTPLPDEAYLFIISGESNSGGIAPNASATAGELAVQTKTFILNNTTYQIEGLDIGTNNLMGHSGLTGCTTHGFELEMANIVTADSFWGDSLFIVKTGSGGSKAWDWSYIACDPFNCFPEQSLFYTNFKTRHDSAVARLSAYAGRIKKIVVLSIGINDRILGTSTDTMHVRMQRYIDNIRGTAGALTPIYITKFPGANNVYNALWETLATENFRFHAVESTPAMSVDGNHWNYSEYKTITQSLMAHVKKNYP